MSKKMEIKMIKVDDLKPYENNPRFNDEAVEPVAKSIKEFGFKVPMVVDKNNVIVAGHTRYKAAMELGLEEVPCVVADDLTDKQIKAFRLADNKVSEKADWDFELLDEELKDLLDFNMEDFGFEDFNADMSYIDNLLEEEYSGKSDSDLFAITFTFNKQYRKTFEKYIKENGKEPLVEELIRKVSESDA